MLLLLYNQFEHFFFHSKTRVALIIPFRDDVVEGQDFMQNWIMSLKLLWSGKFGSLFSERENKDFKIYTYILFLNSILGKFLS